VEKKDYRDIERILKGAANHRRVQIIDTLERRPELSVSDIAEILGIDFRTASEHLRKLTAAGLVMKRHEGAAVCHALTVRGKHVLKFCRTLE
jgi:DNA-binding transcriptional ArsR family regulator